MAKVKIEPSQTTKTLGFAEYTALKNNFDFALKIGSVIKLNVTIESTHACDNVTQGYYKVIGVDSLFSHNQHDARFHSYTFSKIRKNGDVIKKYATGWSCQIFDVDILGKGYANKMEDFNA